MSEKLRDYQVIDVFCGGTFYKVRHKVTSKIFAWKAFNCSAYTDEQIQNVINEVKTISKVTSENLLQYYDTILHAPSKTLYFVLEYTSWRSVQELCELCKTSERYLSEGFIWYLLRKLATACKAVEHLQTVVLQKCFTPTSIFVDESGDLRINCFDLTPSSDTDMMRQVGEIIHTLCYRPGASDDKLLELHYSTDLRDVVDFLNDKKNANLRPDVVLYHPTILANLETLSGPKCLSDILVSVTKATSHPLTESEVNKCDSEKAVDLCRTVKPQPRRNMKKIDSPIYCNISPKHKPFLKITDECSDRNSLSPTIAALALELPGFVPRSRRPYSEAMDNYICPQQVSENTLSHQWMSRLMALRQREESLNKRERNLIAKEIVSSPTTKIIPLNDSLDILGEAGSNGITLPPEITQARDDREQWVSRRRHRRAGSVRAKGRRKSYAYEDLDSSLSADTGDGSIIITATKFTKENMPRRNIFPEVSTKKVHFTSSNPFAESDESVTLTFYELESLDGDGYQVPRQQDKSKDISKFKYLNLEKITSEKRAAIQCSNSSPSKHARVTKNIFSDLTNTDGSLRKTPSKISLTSKSSDVSRGSVMSSKSQWSVDSKLTEGYVSDRTRSSIRQTLVQTPVAPPEVKKSKTRKSLLPFKTPFKFRTSTKV